MQVNSLHETAWEIPNFLLDDEVKHFMSFISGCDDSSWYADMATGHWAGRSLLLRDTGDAHIEETTDRVQDRLFSSFYQYKRIHQLNSILRALPGQSMGPHRDDVEQEDKINVYGVVIYLNDDYEGGEIYYPEYDIAHKPKAKSMVIHRASTIHGVNPVVGEKVRYILTSFVKGDESTSIKGA